MNTNVMFPQISGVTTAQANNAKQLATMQAPEGAPFSQYLNEAMANVVGADYVNKTANVGLLTGTLDNMHTAAIAGEKAEVMLNLTMQVRNKVVESYQEVMRMQM